IECSAMAGKYLGSGFDVHGGGMDLIFPHHENEIAQSEAATCECFARHWFHVAHLMVEGRKMSKSLGNLYSVEDIERCGFTAEELRYVLLSGQYRQPLNFTWDSLVAARSALQRLAEFRDLLPAVGEGGGKGSGGRLEFGEFSPVFEALLDDLNTPAALGALFRIVRELMKGGMSEERAERVRVGFENLLWTFGFRLPSVGGVGVDEPPAEVVEIARERWEAKKRKDWTAADGLRRRLAELGWAVRDGPEGYTLLRQPAGGGGKKMNLQGE
ncbi:MAG: class I tRNA ligase family protein, partial [Chthoniobacterales bacterium]|nr:class I tRNA ligase family protein [Chthoniobacterales bacterium]